MFIYEESNGSISTLATWIDSTAGAVSRLLDGLHAQDLSTLSFWKAPDGLGIHDAVERKNRPSTFLQCAGTKDAMTIEWRREDPDGQERLYVLGHGGPRHATPSVDIPFHDGDAHTFVHPDEVFDHDEATEIFTHYVETLSVPDRYTLREFDLTWPKP